MARRINFRTDSVLGNLPEERQEQIAQWVMECKEGDRYEKARKQLAEDGIKVSRTALFDWFVGWRQRQRISFAESLSSKVEEALKATKLNLTAEQISEAGQFTFTTEALAAENAEEFREMEYLKIARDNAKTKAKFEAQKIAIRKQAEERAQKKLLFEINKHLDTAAAKLLDQSLRKKAEELNASNLSQAEKIAAMRKVAFADVDAYLEQGKLNLPE